MKIQPEICMLCDTVRTDSTRSHYNKVSMICKICGTIESAYLVLYPNTLKDKPKIMWSVWRSIIKRSHREISSLVRLAYIRNGVTIYPQPSRDDIIKWIGSVLEERTRQTNHVYDKEKYYKQMYDHDLDTVQK